MTNPIALRAAAEAGDAAALAALVARLDRMAAPVSQGEAITDMLRSERPEVRAAACAWIGRTPHPDLAPLIVPRLSDADWRVRSAAFDAVQRMAGGLPGSPTSPAPLRDTPVDQREGLVFAWINGLRAAAGEAAVAAWEHCELYAPAGGNWLTGTKLAQSCFACHAPPDTYATADFARCADCHGQAHAEWAGSAHARSTTHINLLRVDERTKQVARVDPGPREGLVCTSCHVPAGAGDAAPTVAGTEHLAVPHRFKPNAAASSCAACHAETQAEWEAWKASPRPLASRWLPGEFTWGEHPDARTCVSCHMQARPAPVGSGFAHGFVARRDAALMRGGLSAQLEPPTGDRGPQLVLTNLAGHRYPSGTIRRALRIELRYDTDPQGTKRLLTRLTDSTVPTTQPTLPALKPGEQRRIDIPLVPGAARVTCEITFERNQFDPGSYELVLHTLSERATR